MPEPRDLHLHHAAGWCVITVGSRVLLARTPAAPQCGVITHAPTAITGELQRPDQPRVTRALAR